MDKRIYQIGTPVTVIFLVVGVLLGARDYLNKPQPAAIASSQPIIPKSGEFTPVTIKDGNSWALVKVWNGNGGLELFNPEIPPSTNLAVIEKAVSSGKFTGIILETGNGKGGSVWGHALLRKTPLCDKTIPAPCSSTITDYDLVPVTEQFVRANSEAFKALKPKEKGAASP